MLLKKGQSIVLSVILYPILLNFNYSKADEFQLLDIFNSPDNIYYGSMTTRGDYMAIGDASEQGVGIDIIDISDPQDMHWITKIQTNHISYQIAWSGNYIYDPSAWNGFFIYDLSDINNIIPAYTGLGPYAIAFIDVTIRNNFAIIGGDEGMLVYNVANPYNPIMVFESNQLGFSRIITGNSIACIFRWTNDVAILDISQPDSPTEISRFSYPFVNGMDMDPAEQYLYLTNWDAGLVIYDITNTLSPQFISQTPMPNQAICIDIAISRFKPSYVFISGYTGGLWAVNVSDPYNPTPTAHYIPPSQCHFVFSKQDLVFLTIPGRLMSFRFDYSTGLEENGIGLPNAPVSSVNYPNPFNNMTTIKYFVPDNCEVIVEVYNELGQRLETLVDGFQHSGYHTSNWDAGRYSSGIYFYRIYTDNYLVTRKITLLK